MLKVNNNIKYLVLVDSLFFGIQRSLATILPLFISFNLTGNIKYVGYLITYSMLLHAAIIIPFTKISSKLTKKGKMNLVTLCLIAMGLCVATLGFIQNLWQLFLLETLILVFDAFQYPIKLVVFTEVIDNDRKEFEWGLKAVSGALGTGIISFISLSLLDIRGFREVYIFLGALFVLAGIFAHLVKESETLN